MEWHSPHSPPSFSGLAKSVGDTNANSGTAPETANDNTKPADVVFPPRPFANNASYSSTDDDSSHETLAGTSSVNNDSDCETIETNGSKCGNCRNSSSAVPSLCSSENASMTSLVDRIDTVTPSNVDKLLLEELQEMSSADRVRVQEEIHGVSSCAIFEDNEKIVEGLKRLEEEIRSIRHEVLLSPDHVSSNGDSYNESMWAYLAVDDENSAAAMSVPNQNRLLYSYIFHRDFRLRFLRADLYDAKKAAHRYLRCVE